jgi:transposase InsO family protein
MFNDAITRKGTPRYLSTEHALLFKYHRWRAHLRVLEIDEMKTIPYTPTSHPFVERLVGTIRGGFLDPTLFWSTLDLERRLDEFRTYYDLERTHSSLGGIRPMDWPVARSETDKFGAVRWRSHC